jgi:hypothetical protein
MTPTTTMYAFVFRSPAGGRWKRISLHSTAEAAWLAALEYPHSGDVRCDRVEVPAGPDLFTASAEAELCTATMNNN